MEKHFLFIPPALLLVTGEIVCLLQPLLSWRLNCGQKHHRFQMDENSYLLMIPAVCILVRVPRPNARPLPRGCNLASNLVPAPGSWKSTSTLPQPLKAEVWLPPQLHILKGTCPTSTQPHSLKVSCLSSTQPLKAFGLTCGISTPPCSLKVCSLYPPLFVYLLIDSYHSLRKQTLLAFLDEIIEKIN